MATTTVTGKVFAERYRLERKLGTGGMADVWLAEDTELGRKVAVKILHERYASDAQFVERFRREATHAAGLSHPNIVPVFDRGASNGSYYIVMEYIEGRTLKELIITRGPCPVPVAISYIRQVLSALRYAHRSGIIHRDIKPHNVIVDREGRAKVTDFGIALAGASQMTEAGSIIGTAQYLSPEQARGALVDESSDLYSTAVVLYEILTGSVPFNGESPVEIAMKHLNEAPEPPSAKRSEVSADLDRIVLRALGKEPSERYRSALEMDRDLETISRNEPLGTELDDDATMVTRSPAPASDSAELTGATTVKRKPTSAYGGDERYRAYDAPVVRRRSVWPWLLGLGVALALAAGGYFLYTNLQQELEKTKTFAVKDYEGIREALAVTNVEADGFVAKISRQANSEVAEGIVFDQDPPAGARLSKGDIVTLLVSGGKAQVEVPDVRGKSESEAVTAITRVGLTVRSVEVPSSQPPNTVTAQDPSPNQVVEEGKEIRINVSKGPKQVGIPNLIGLGADTATEQLKSLRFAVKVVDVESDEATGTVVGQDPPANLTRAEGSVVVLSVSKGPTEVEVPDVTNTNAASARVALEAEGFRVIVELEDSVDPLLDDVVLAQEPIPLSLAPPETRVTIYVGRYVAPPAPDPAPTIPDPAIPDPAIPDPAIPDPTNPDGTPTDETTPPPSPDPGLPAGGSPGTP